MKVLTLHQPWASLIAIGAKTIETRSWSTPYRGPLAIHAGMTKPASWLHVGDYQVRGFGRTGLALDGPGLVPFRSTPRLEGHMLRLGSVVAVCDLVDVVPIVDGSGCRDGSPHVCVASWGALAHSRLHEPWPDGETEHDVTDQVPYGDFTPGRYGWLLDNVRPIDPVRMKGSQGIRDVDEAVLEQINERLAG